MPEWERLRAREELARWRMNQDAKAHRESTELWRQACRELVAHDKELMADV
jgi:hypothetical protein